MALSFDTLSFDTLSFDTALPSHFAWRSLAGDTA